MKIKAGDTVQIIAGKDKGKSGKVLKSFPKEERVLVEGANIVKRHKRARQRGQEHGILQKPAPLHVSNVMIVDPASKVRTRVANDATTEKKKRVSKKTRKSVDK